MWSGGLEKMEIFFPCLGSQLSSQFLLSTAPPPAQTVETPVVFTRRLGWALPGSSVCCSVPSDSLRPDGLQHARLSCPFPSPGACSDSSALSR